MHYTLFRSGKRKTIAIQIQPDASVVVRAPNWVPQKEIDRFVAAKQDWIVQHQQQQNQRNQAAAVLSPPEIEALWAQAQQLLPERVAYYSEKMGLVPTGIRITGAKTRFGSCSGKNSLCFSYRLLRYPPEAIDYVVVHELAHLRYKNHGADFYRLIAAYLPDYPKRIAMLRDPQYRIR